MVAIETHDLTKQYGTVLAVDDLSLSIPEGVVYGVWPERCRQNDHDADVDHAHETNQWFRAG